MDLARRIRKVEAVLGPACEITLLTGTDGKPMALSALDHETGERHSAKLGPPSKYERQVMAFHESIYHSRARAKHEEQGGKCAKCGHVLGNLGECNHINHRGKNGRDDRSINLEIVCTVFHGGCDWHRREHAGGKRG